MKQIAENRTYDVRESWDRDHLVPTGMIVWLGSSEYWSRVFLNKETGRLMVAVDGTYCEPLDKFNIRKTDFF